MVHKLKVALTIGASILSLSACQNMNDTNTDSAKQAKKVFVSVSDTFLPNQKNLRKWDAPVVADLDQDGYPDLLLNDHGFSVQVVWNNQGTFGKPYDLIMGDMHGISVGDFDQDTNLEIIISRGGGSGSNARNSKIFRVDKKRKFTSVPDFNTPLAMMRGRTVMWADLNNDGHLDLINFAFPSGEKKGQSENYIYANDGQGQLVHKFSLPPSFKDGQKVLLTDFNGDNKFDILMYGDKKVKAYQGAGDFTFTDVSASVLPNNLHHVTGIAEIDFDNDGDFDLYFSRGKEFTAGETFYDPESKTWAYYTKRGEFNFEGLAVGDVINIENLQSQWPHKHLYIGESGYEHQYPGETHSGRDLRLVNSDSLGFPETLTKKGTYIGYVGNDSWRIAGNIWSPSTGVIHNVPSYPSYPHTEGLSDVLLRNDGGKFVDITAESKLTVKAHSTGVAVSDFNNDGYQDLVVTLQGQMVRENESLLYMNDGKGKFTETKNHGIVSPELGAIGMGVTVLDYNVDGKQDVLLGNERGKWHLFNNQFEDEADSQSIRIKVPHSDSGKATALGALVKVEACGVSQMQRVGMTSAAYSLNYIPELVFGLGTCQDKVNTSILWTDGSSRNQ